MNKNDKKIEVVINEFGELFSSDGEYFEAGCNTDDLEKIRSHARELNSSKRVCYVSKWCWWDLEASEELKVSIEKQGKRAVVIKSDFVLSDERGRFVEGDWVRTSLLTTFHPPALFETENTFYILVGPGTRKTVPIKFAFSLV